MRPFFLIPTQPWKKPSPDKPSSASPPSGHTPDCTGLFPGCISAPPSTSFPAPLSASSLGSSWHLLHLWCHFFTFPRAASLWPSHSWGEVMSSTFPLPGWADANLAYIEVRLGATCLAFQMLRLQASNVRGVGSIPGLRTKIPYAKQHGQENK